MKVMNPYEQLTLLTHSYSGRGRTIRAREENVIKGFVPFIPDAYPDGVLPNDALERGLAVHAPVIASPGHNSVVGNEFNLVVDGESVPGTTVVYSSTDTDHVVLQLPIEFAKGLSEGFHDIAYRDAPKPWGPAVRSESKQVLIDRTPVGARRLPRIEFPDDVQREGLSLASLLAMPDARLTGVVPGYTGFDRDDKLHIYLRPLDGKEVHVHTVNASLRAGDATSIELDRAMLERAGVNGSIDVYYYVEDKANNRSRASTSTPLNLYIIGAPESVRAPRVITAAAGFVTEKDIKPDLAFEIPSIEPRASAGDIVALYAGNTALAVTRLKPGEVAADPMTTIRISYNDIWDTFVKDEDLSFKENFWFAHFHESVPSRSRIASSVFDLSVPGGRDPDPSTGHNESLPTPVLRGASGSRDNYISLEDAEHDAEVVIDSSLMRGKRLLDVANGDVVMAFLDEALVGEPVEIKDGRLPIRLVVPSADLKANAGRPGLSYTVTRALSLEPNVIVATSPGQLVSIESVDGLPGGGRPLKGAIFVDAFKLEIELGVYGIHESELVKGYTPIRIYGYANMSEGDVVNLTYDGYDSFDAGKHVPAASGHLKKVIEASDLEPKYDDISGTPEKAVFFDLNLDAAIVYTLSFGRFETSYTITNAVGQGDGSSRPVLVSARIPAKK